CVAGLVVALLVARPLTAQVIGNGALYALGFPLGYATVGLGLTPPRPGNPIGWLFAASALTWSLIIPLGPWVDQLARDQRPLPLLGKLYGLAAGDMRGPPARQRPPSAPPCPRCWSPTGGSGRAAGGWWRRPP